MLPPILAASALGLAQVGLACASPRPGGHADRAAYDAETCAAIPEQERRSSPLEAPYTIENIAPVHRYQWIGRRGQRRPVPGSGRLTEVLVTIQAPAWTTLDAMDARLQCHIAWMRSDGDHSPAMESCPLAVPGVFANVRMGYGQRFMVAIQGQDERAVKEAWRRVRAMAPADAKPSERGEQLE